MKLPQIISSGVYRKKELIRQKFFLPHICLYVSGLKYRRTYDPEGQLFYYADSSTPPCLRIVTPGFRTEIEYGNNRENWIIMMNFDALQYQSKTRSFSLNYRGTVLSVPDRVDLSASEVSALQKRFQVITENFKSAIPRKIMTAEIMTSSLFHYFITDNQTYGNDAAEQFRLRLDQDEQWNMSLEEHCKVLGYDRNRIRRIFVERYKITPNEYRTNRRLQKIINLFVHTNLSLKEIAFAVGMKNVTHLNSLLLQHYGKTPSTLCREYRYSNPLKNMD